MGRNVGFFSSYGYHHNVGANTWRSRAGGPASLERAGLERIVFSVTDGNEPARLRQHMGDAGITVLDVSDIVLHDPDIELQFVLGRSGSHAIPAR
jgi:catechol-2,3-dioxygenase